MKTPPRAFVKVSGKIRDLKLTNNTVVGASLLDSQDGTVEGLQLEFNKVFGTNEAVRLGDIFGAEVAGNLFSVKVPKTLVSELRAAGLSTEKKKSLLQRLSSLARPSEMRQSLR
jgi:hypothetical protein